jgi:hypothetical protein
MRSFLLSATGILATMILGSLVTLSAFAQNQAAQVSGLITDPSGSVVPNADLVVLNKDNHSSRTTKSNGEGYYVLPLLQPGNYTITVTVPGFKTLVREGIELAATQNARIDFALKMGATTETVDVVGNAPALNQENPTLETGISPTTVTDLPLIVAGGPRNMAPLLTLVPGVTSPTNDATNAHMNGGLAFEEETILDGVGITYASGGNGTFNLAFDFPQSPDMVREVHVLTSNYEPQYGNSAAANIILETKSGTDAFHGTAFDYERNTVLNARQYGAATRSPDIEHEFGASLGGPVKIPGLRSARSKPFFFIIWEGYRDAGAPSVSALSIPSLSERNGDFRDWTDSSGNLIPIYDPATTQIVNGQVVRQQFMGCDGKTPNVICPTDPRLANSLAKQWLQFLPTPTSNSPLNNYLPPHPPASIYSNRNTLDMRGDEYYGDKDHVSVSAYRNETLPIHGSLLPAQLATENACGSGCAAWMVRLGWDHTISPTLLNHFGYGWTRNGYGSLGFINAPYVKLLPQLPGLTPGQTPLLSFSDGFQSFDGSNASSQPSKVSIWNDLFSWSRGKHTFKFGAEYRRISLPTCRIGSTGLFSFARGETGLLGVNSGSPIASLLLEQVDATTKTVYGEGGCYTPQQIVLVGHAGDTWKATSKLTLTYGVRYDLHPPSVEKNDRMSFFDPLGLNAGAGNRLGSLAFAGTKWGDASFGSRYPEKVDYRLFAPRLGVAYSLSPKTVVRSGYGIFYSDAKYPGWSMGVATAGFDANPIFSSTLGGLQAASLLSQGFPQNFTKPPFINGSYLNGQTGPFYRPFDANHIPYSQQWDLAIEHQFTNDFYVSTAYVGNKGTHLYSRNDAPNALNPSLLSMGNALYDQFGPNDTALDGVPAPYAGWAQEMTTCAPSVAQALLPYPQYCGGIVGINENKGNSEFQSLQVKAEKRTSNGVYLLASYTFSKLITSVDSTQPDSELGGTTGAFSPFQQQRNKSIAAEDIPQTLSVAFIYQLPFGRGKRWLGGGGGFLRRLVDGWETSGVFHASSAPPYFFRSSSCNVPAQFVAGCVPAILPGADPFAQSTSHFDPSKPLFDIAAFQNPANSNGFSFDFGQGTRVSNLRAFPYHNLDFALVKRTPITERVNFEFRSEFFNFFNWHIFQTQGQVFGPNSTAFTTDVASPTFGMWNGSVTRPRNIQVSGRINF